MPGEERGDTHRILSVAGPVDREMLRRGLGPWRNFFRNATSSVRNSLQNIMKMTGLETQLVYVKSQQMI